MATAGPAPAWYRRLPPSLRRVAEASDRFRTLPLRPDPALHAIVAALPPALREGDPVVVQRLAQRLADLMCADLRVPSVRIRVALRRPPLRGGELHGLYQSDQRRTHDITVWMLTAKRGQVVRYRTFLRTMLHELCHHCDYHLLCLRESLHTQGFYQRESSLFASLGAGEVDEAGASPYAPLIDPDRSVWSPPAAKVDARAARKR